ncbi:MAG: hypothetical protein IAF02_00740 [Anaerolineae bacterium]|nr:hypothetical protein [Anaerolineae bacterium]
MTQAPANPKEPNNLTNKSTPELVEGKGGSGVARIALASTGRSASSVESLSRR